MKMSKTNPNIETNETSDNITQKQTTKEEQMTLLSSLFIEQKSLEENQKTEFNHELIDEKVKEEEKSQLNSYENLSDNEITERISKSINTLHNIHLHMHIHQWLENDKTLFQFIRQYATLLAKYSSLKMELESYQSYMKMVEHLLPWLSTLYGILFIRNNIQYDQFVPIRQYINKKLKRIEKEFTIITEKLAKSITDQLQQQISSSSSTTTSDKVDIKLLTSLIGTFVREDQQGLNIEFIKKRHLLLLNVKDISLIHEFYYLQPSFEQVCQAERIWEATINKQRSYKIMTNNLQNPLESFDDSQEIELAKNSFSALKIADNTGHNMLPMDYSQLNFDLLINTIESRQKILVQHLAFQNEFSQLFVTNNNPVNDDDDKNNEEL